MPWDLKDDDLVAGIAARTAPPTNVETLLADDFWSNAFSMWSTDVGYRSGDYQASKLHHLWADLKYGTSGETIRAQYVDPTGPSVLPWPTAVFDRFERVANGMDSDYTGALAELRGATIEALEPHVSKFSADILEIQSKNVSPPTPVEARLVRPDMSMVDRVNQAILKDLPEFNKDKAKATVKWFANTEIVLIGENHPPSYYEYLKAKGHTEGRLMMMKRGGAFSPGRVEIGIMEVYRPDGDKDVNNLGLSPNQDDVRQAVTDAISRVSNKEVKHLT